jgi:hypothetical protein
MERHRQRATDDWLEKALHEVEIALHPLPKGYVIEKHEPSESILVYHVEVPGRLDDGWGFVISKMAIDKGYHIQNGLDAFQDLVKQVDSKMAASGESADGASL